MKFEIFSNKEVTVRIINASGVRYKSRLVKAPRLWRWRLRAKNGRIIATSAESYTKKAFCTEMVNTIRREVWSAHVALQEPRTSSFKRIG